MKKYTDKIHALFMAIAWTISAILAIALILQRGAGSLRIIAAVIFTADAVFWWMNYAKKRLEEETYE